MLTYTSEYIQKLSYMDNLPLSQIEEGAIALSGLASLLGKEWVEEFIGGYVTGFTLTLAIELWACWKLIEKFDKASQLLPRWRQGYRKLGVESEILVASRFVKAAAVLELEPKCGTRIPDFRTKFGSGRWIYAEVTKRGISVGRKSAQRTMESLTGALLLASEVGHSQLALRKCPDDCELQELLAWIRDLRSMEDCCYADFAGFFVGDRDAGVDVARMRELVPKPHLYQTRIHGNRMATVCMPVYDRNINTILKHEAAQLPKSEPSMLFIDVSNVVGGVEEWTTLIASCYQPNIRTRISASVVFSSSASPTSLIFDARVIPNPYAALPLSDDELRQLCEICQT